MTLPLQRAEKIAAVIATEITGFCDRVEVAGSVRRRRPFVNDIDLVIVPKAGEESALRARFARRCSWIREGEQEWVLSIMLSPDVTFQLDIWIAQPERKDLFETKPSNFGSLLICRTGSMEHNIYLIEHAKRLGLRWNPHWGVFDGRGQCLASATEEDVFQALQLDFVPPERRER